MIPIGVQLSSEKDGKRLLEKIVMEAKTFCRADAGTLYAVSQEKQQLEFVIVRNDTCDIAQGGTTKNDVTFAPLPLQSDELDYEAIATQVALNGNSSNIADHGKPSTIIAEYQIKSMLTIPLKNSADQVLGVLQLINSLDSDSNEVIPFDQNLQQMMESFSSLAVAALEAYIREQSLRQEIKKTTTD